MNLSCFPLSPGKLLTPHHSPPARRSTSCLYTNWMKVLKIDSGVPQQLWIPPEKTLWDELNSCVLCIALHRIQTCEVLLGQCSQQKKQKQWTSVVPSRFCSTCVTVRLWANHFISPYCCICTSKTTDTTTSSKKQWNDSLVNVGPALSRGKSVLLAGEGPYICKAQAYL